MAMKEIKWKYPHSRDYAYAQVGCIVMHANLHYTGTATKRWYANVSIQERSGTFRTGPVRKSIARAKEDAVQLARELLGDYHTCLLTEMANFGLEA